MATIATATIGSGTDKDDARDDARGDTMDFADRIAGAIFGCALGDALGLPAEGGDKRILAERYPQGIPFPHQTPTRDFPLNDWTDDTDLTVLVMRALGARGGAKETACSFAEQLVDWFRGGFPELGDTHGAGCGNLTWRVLRMAHFLEDPFRAAEDAIGPKAGNGALMRTAPCAFTSDPVAWARVICLATHSDPRCVASCVAQSVLIRELAHSGRHEPLDPEILRTALEAARPTLHDNPKAWQELMSWAWKSQSLGEMDLGGRDARGYTLKAFSCSLWALRVLFRSRGAHGCGADTALFKSALTELVMEGGDADTNAAVAGATLGAAIGYKRLPQDWIAATPNHAWLAQEIGR